MQKHNVEEHILGSDKSYFLTTILLKSIVASVNVHEPQPRSGSESSTLTQKAFTMNFQRWTHHRILNNEAKFTDINFILSSFRSYNIFCSLFDNGYNHLYLALVNNRNFIII